MLPELFGEVVVPPAVASELKAAHPRFPALDVSRLPFMRVQAPSRPEAAFDAGAKLHRGEVEAIALALELRATLLMDETHGRRAADRVGLQAVGTLGVLGRAKLQGLIPAVRPLAERLVREIRFFVDSDLLTTFLRQLGE